MEPVKAVLAASADSLAPPSSSPAKAAPTLYDVVRGAWTASVTSGALMWLLVQLEPMAERVPHPVASWVLAAVVHFGIILLRQYAKGPVSYR